MLFRSLVYPGFGVEAVRSAPPQSRGVAMGTYTAFLDLSLGLASPALGFIAQVVNLEAVFLISAVVVLGTAAIALRLLRPTAIERRGMGRAVNMPEFHAGWPNAMSAVPVVKNFFEKRPH